jgi:hypothetical protein
MKNCDAYHMKDARFTIATPGLLAKVVDLIDGVPMEDRDTKGSLLLSSTAPSAASFSSSSTARGRAARRSRTAG